MHRAELSLLTTSVPANVVLATGTVPLRSNRLNVISRILAFGRSSGVANRSTALNLRKLQVNVARRSPRIGLCALEMIWIRLRLCMVYGLCRYRRFRRVPL